jgi:putative phosphoribosyl transferase
VYHDRHEAGRRLGEQLRELGLRADLVLGVPRGGVPVALEVAEVLGAPLDVVVVRRVIADLGAGTSVTVGAVGESGARVVDEELVQQIGVSGEELAALERIEELEVAHQVHRFRGDRPRAELQGRHVVVVDDVVTSGSSVRAACRIVRRLGAAQVVVAVPVAPELWAERIADDVERVVALELVPHEPTVGRVYANVGPVGDDAVVGCLQAAARATELRSR